jgi:hypothetical protein
MTDAHLFDSGAHNTTMGGYQAFVDNESSLAWTILEVNRLVSSGKRIDFMLFTGDFGLEETDCGNIPRKKASSQPLILCPEAVDTVAAFLRALLVDKVLMVPGNNDVPDEDPQNIAVYNDFMQRLKAKLATMRSISSTPFPPVVVDLASQTEMVNGISILGLDSSTFKNTSKRPGDRSAINSAVQGRIIEGLIGRLPKGQPAIIVTHIPNLEDPFREGGIKRAWNLDPVVATKWESIVKQPNVIAVFAGHFHDPRRNIYMHDYSWDSSPPGRVEGDKTWVAPPLAAKFQANSKPQARGFLIATVTAAGDTTAQPVWYSLAEAPDQLDKADKLREGDSQEQVNDYEKAATAYQQALSSRDSWIRSQAEAGLQRVLKEANHRTWTGTIFLRFVNRWWRDVLIGATLLLLMLAWAYLRRKPPRVITPTKWGADAPADLFLVWFLSEVHEIQATWANSPMTLETSHEMVLDLAPDTAATIVTALPKLIGEVPAAALKILLAINRFFAWKIETAVYGTESDAAVYANLSWGWFTRRSWIVPAAGDPRIGVRECASRMAYNIVTSAIIRS